MGCRICSSESHHSLHCSGMEGYGSAPSLRLPAVRHCPWPGRSHLSCPIRPGSVAPGSQAPQLCSCSPLPFSSSGLKMRLCPPSPPPPAVCCHTGVLISKCSWQLWWRICPRFLVQPKGWVRFSPCRHRKKKKGKRSKINKKKESRKLRQRQRMQEIRDA